MLQTLRSRLLLSYSLIIGVMLVVIGIFLLLALAVSQRSRLLPQAEALVRIDRGVMATLREQGRSQAGLTEEAIRATLQEIADELNARLLIVGPADTVIFDSLGEEEGGSFTATAVADRLWTDSNLFDGNVSLIRFNDGGESWLGLERLFPMRMGQRGLRFISAIPETTTLATFRNSFLWPLAQAGGAAFLVAALLAWWISRSVAKPLQDMSQAAEAIAEGHFDQQLSPGGPQEVQLLADSFNRMATQVKQTQESQRDFVANVSHDLKTPLTSIQGWSQALLDGTAADPQALARAAQVIHEESSRMTRMVNQLLALARLESGRMEPVRRPVALVPLLEDVNRALQFQAQQREIELRTDIQSDDGAVVGDRDQLLQLVTNLVENALDNTPAGGRIILKLWRENEGEICLGVQDTGRGIPPAELPRIFERFYQVDKSRSGRQRGTGLGLSIVRQIAEAHGGRVDVTSLEGQGSLFRVCLPLDGRQPGDHLR